MDPDLDLDPPLDLQVAKIFAGYNPERRYYFVTGSIYQLALSVCPHPLFLALRKSVFLWSRENGRYIIVFAVMYERVNLPCMCFMIGIHSRILQEAFLHKSISI